MHIAALIDEADRCVLAVRGGRDVLVAPMACWSDGDSLWMATPAGSAKVGALRAADDVSIAVRGPDGIVVATGSPRVYAPDQPLALALHGPAITGAMGALALRNPKVVTGYLRDAAKVPARFALPGRAVVRVRLGSDAALVAYPVPRSAVAPALPAVIDPVVRRRLSGRRGLLLAVDRPPGPPQLVPAAWDQSMALVTPPGHDVPDGAAVVAIIDDDPQTSPLDVVGVALRGDVRDGCLVPRRAMWWAGFERQSADVPARPAGGVVIPD